VAASLENRIRQLLTESPHLPTLIQSEFTELTLLARGKVRDLYEVGSDLLLLATDRISAFDHVLGSGIPDKGEILTQMSVFWFDFLKDVVRNHLISTNVEEYPAALQPYAESLRGRSMYVRRAKMFPVECVVRGYLSGSGWKDYKATGGVCGIPLPPGLKESDKLPEPLFTPASKSQGGEHDENVSFAQVIEQVGQQHAEKLRDLSLEIYSRAASHAASCGLILADTKFEFGMVDGEIILADEVLTPDSSRYWPADQYAPGGVQPSFDKQFVRDYLEEIHWNKQAPAPPLPESVVLKTRGKYLEALRLVTGKGLGA
jgi:phosphoribosylaminoimidazole-succinocarboxamide synthase